MLRRLTLASLILSILVAGVPATAQTLRFQTNVAHPTLEGETLSFDMRLNPTNDLNLQPLVDNILAYAGLGRYHFSAINRAAFNSPGDPFVLQMGGFLAFPPVTNQWTNYLTPIEKLPEVVVDNDRNGTLDFVAKSNARATVSLALSTLADDPETTDVNSGSSSFFVNLGNNSALDADGFVPFAEIVDMTTIDAIMALEQVDLSNAAGSPGNLTFVDVPTLANNHMVVITDVTVVDADPNFSFVGPISNALQAVQGSASASSASLAVTADQGGSFPIASSASVLAATAIPEPSTALLAIAAAGWLGRSRARRRQTRQ